MAGTLRIRTTEDETALHGCRCRVDMIVRMRKVQLVRVLLCWNWYSLYRGSALERKAVKCILLGFFLVRLKAFNGIIFSHRINEDTDLIWATTPTGWSVLLIQSFYGAWSDGAGTFVHYKKVTPREALKTLQEYPITVAQFRPSIYIKTLDEGSHDSFKFPTLKRCFVAGEPSNKEMLRRWREKTGVALWDFYGQTELVCFKIF